MTTSKQHIAETKQDIEITALQSILNIIATMPNDTQDGNDGEFAEHFALSVLASSVNSRLTKLNDRVKDGVRSGVTSLVTNSKHYSRICSVGTSRSTFDANKFIDLVATTYPEIPKHKLREIADDPNCFKQSAAPISVAFEFRDED